MPRSIKSCDTRGRFTDYSPTQGKVAVADIQQNVARNTIDIVIAIYLAGNTTARNIDNSRTANSVVCCTRINIDYLTARNANVGASRIGLVDLTAKADNHKSAAFDRYVSIHVGS